MGHALRRSVWVVPAVCVPLLASEDDALRPIIERGPNHAVHHHLVSTFDEVGRPMTVTNTWTQLEDGLNYWNSETESCTEAREEAFPSRIAVASAPFLTEPGVVMDDTMMVVGEYNDTFRCDETYHITGNCWFTGATLLDGGT